MFSSKKYIYEVYKEKSFSKAAKNLFISQPALSATVKRTEEQLGVPIFDRSCNPIKLTDCGKKYIQAIEQIQGVEQDFSNYLNDYQNMEIGRLSIGGSNLFSSYVLPPLITEFSKKFPKIQVSLQEESTANLEQQLLNGRLDLIIDNYIFDESQVASHLYETEHLILCVPKKMAVNHTLAASQIPAEAIQSRKFLENTYPSVSLKSFSDTPFVMLKEENDTGERGLTICREQNFKPHILLRLDQLMTAYNITCSGLGASFISDTLVGCVPLHPDIVFYKLDSNQVSRNIYFYRKRSKYMTKAMKEFLKIAEAVHR